MKSKAQQIKQYIEDNLSMDEIVEIYNNYAECNRYELISLNDREFINSQFKTPYNALKETNEGNYNFKDKYVFYNGYNYPETFNKFDDDNSPIDLSELADYIADDGDCGFVEIDNDVLKQQFIYELVFEHNINVSRVEDEVEDYLDEEGFDFLADDWNDLEKIIISRI